MIGIASMAPMVFAIMQIIILTKDQYCEIYGNQELYAVSRESVGQPKYCGKVAWVKIKRVMKEIFMLQPQDEFGAIKSYKRVIRHQMFIGVMQNLIMAVYIL